MARADRHFLITKGRKIFHCLQEYSAMRREKKVLKKIADTFLNKCLIQRSVENWVNVLQSRKKTLELVHKANCLHRKSLRKKFGRQWVIQFNNKLQENEKVSPRKE